jgi:hypothetical protein
VLTWWSRGWDQRRFASHADPIIASADPCVDKMLAKKTGFSIFGAVLAPHAVDHCNSPIKAHVHRRAKVCWLGTQVSMKRPRRRYPPSGAGYCAACHFETITDSPISLSARAQSHFVNFDTAIIVYVSVALFFPSSETGQISFALSPLKSASKSSTSGTRHERTLPGPANRS